MPRWHRLLTGSPHLVLPPMHSLLCSFPGEGQFLLYNEDTRLCLAAQSSGAVRTAACQPGARCQAFRWVSQQRLLSVASARCLGAPYKQNQANISLYSCHTRSELLRWDCRNGTLAVPGQSLFLSAGRREEDTAVLSTGPAAGQRWRIYGTMEELCSRGHEGEAERLILVVS